VFYVLLGHLENALKSQQIELMEPAILVLGAISAPDGAYGLIQIHLTNLVPYLMEILNNNNEILRSTTLWTLSQFSDWIGSQYQLDEYLTMLCQRMNDSDQNVQEAACMAFSVLVESVSAEKILPLLAQPLAAFTVLIDVYKGNTLSGLFDAIGQMAVQMKDEWKSVRAEDIRS
jgi:transportin-1